MNRALMAVLAAAITLAPAGASAGTPATGIDEQLRAGLFFDLNVGGSFVAGAQNRTVSNAQVTMKWELGYDIIKTPKPSDFFGLGLGIYYQLGAAANACFDTWDDKKQLCSGTSDFEIHTFAAEVIFKLRLIDRLYFRPRIVLGFDYLPPTGDNTKVAGGIGGFKPGLGVGIEYATHLDHFNVGIDVDAGLIIGPNIPTVAFYPMVKYTF